MKELATKQDIQNFEVDWKFYLKNFIVTQSGLSHKTAKTYKTAITKFISYLDDNEINRPLPDDIHEYQGFLKDNQYSVFTIGLYMIALKKFFAYLETPYKSLGAQSITVYKDIYAMANPTVQRPARGVHYRENLTDEAIDLLRGKLIDSEAQKDRRDLLMIDIGLYCGCRVNEIANIKTTDIVKDGDNYRLYLLRKNQSGKVLSVFIAENIVTRMKAYIKKYKIDGYLFCDLSHAKTGKGNHLCSSTISTIISKHMINAEIKKDTITPHSMRHNAGTAYYQATKDLYATQQFMGHRDSKTTEIYMHVDANYEKNGLALQPA